jgi:small-conductance mechanosensitive channel
MSYETYDSKRRSRKSAVDPTTAAAEEEEDDETDELETQILDNIDEWKRHIEKREQRHSDREIPKSEVERQKDERKRILKEMGKLRERLLQASRNRNLKRLREVICDAQDSTKSPPVLRSEYRDLRPVYDRAVELLTSIEKLENFQRAKEKIGHATVDEIKRMNNMREAIHQVVLASLMLLSYTSEQNQSVKRQKTSWPECQNECVVSGENALHKRIAKLDSKSLTPATVCKVLGLLDPYDRKFLCGLSGAVGLLYDWVIGICEKKLLADEKAMKRRKRQKEIAADEEQKLREHPYYEEDKKTKKESKCAHCQINRADAPVKSRNIS